MQYLFGITMFVTAIFLILLVLVQRGRGGGLAGALGGAGGQSAFGAKAGDTFTKITIYASTFWILLCIAAVWTMNRQVNVASQGPAEMSAPAGSSEEVPAGDESEGSSSTEESTEESEEE